MAPRLALLAFALLLPQLAAAAEASAAATPAPVAECAGDAADATHASVHFDGKASDVLGELVRVKHLEVAHAELLGDATITLTISCASVNFFMDALAEASRLQSVREGAGRYRFAKVRNIDAITKLRDEADAARSKDRPKLVQSLKQIVALSQPGGPGEPAASVEAEYHELGNLAMKDKDYAAAERHYRARLADLDRAHPEQDTNYAIAVSNIADALAYQDDFAGATPIYERALAIMEKQQGDPAAPPNAVTILETLSNVALAAKRYDEAELHADRAWKLLSDPGRSQWESPEQAIEFAAASEGELGQLGPKQRSLLHYERALTLLEARYPADDKELVEMRLQVMLGASKDGRLDRAREVAEQQLAAAERRGEPTSDAYVVALYQLLSLHAEQGRLDRVIALWPRLIEARRALLGDNSPHVVAALQQLATLYRVNGQWAEAAALDKRAAAIKPVDDSEALDKVEPIVSFAMEYDPALPVFCGRYALRSLDVGYSLVPPAPPVSALVFFEPTTSPAPMPADKPAQARYYERIAECFSDSPTYAGAATELALRLRVAVNGAQDPETRRAAGRTIEFYRQAGDAKGVERVRALAGG